MRTVGGLVGVGAPKQIRYLSSVQTLPLCAYHTCLILSTSSSRPTRHSGNFYFKPWCSRIPRLHPWTPPHSPMVWCRFQPGLTGLRWLGLKLKAPTAGCMTISLESMCSTRLNPIRGRCLHGVCMACVSSRLTLLTSWLSFERPLPAMSDLPC